MATKSERENNLKKRWLNYPTGCQKGFSGAMDLGLGEIACPFLDVQALHSSGNQFVSVAEQQGHLTTNRSETLAEWFRPEMWGSFAHAATLSHCRHIWGWAWWCPSSLQLLKCWWCCHIHDCIWIILNMFKHHLSLLISPPPVMIECATITKLQLCKYMPGLSHLSVKLIVGNLHFEHLT